MLHTNTIVVCLSAMSCSDNMPSSAHGHLGACRKQTTAVDNCLRGMLAGCDLCVHLSFCPAEVRCLTSAV